MRPDGMKRKAAHPLPMSGSFPAWQRVLCRRVPPRGSVSLDISAREQHRPARPLPWADEGRPGRRNTYQIQPPQAVCAEREAAAMKVKSSIKRRTLDCQIVRRKGKLYIINKKNPRMKQRQG